MFKQRGCRWWLRPEGSGATDGEGGEGPNFPSITDRREADVESRQGRSRKRGEARRQKRRRTRGYAVAQRVGKNREQQGEKKECPRRGCSSVATGGEAGRGGGLRYLRFREFRAETAESKPVFVRGFYVILHLQNYSITPINPITILPMPT